MVEPLPGEDEATIERGAGGSSVAAPLGKATIFLAIIAVAALGWGVEWGCYQFEKLSNDELEAFFWLESAIASLFFAFVAVLLFGVIRGGAALILAGALFLGYLLLIGLVYQVVFDTREFGFIEALGNVALAPASTEYYINNFRFYADAPIYLLHGAAIIVAAYWAQRVRR